MNLVCINCPKGCHLTVEQNGEEITVTGNSCPRGVTYARSELLNPLRTLTTTIAIDAKESKRLPVITSKPIPKGRLMDVMKALKGDEVKAPIKIGEVIVSDILSLGSDIIASKSVAE